jgi:predicted nucleic acid-binding protein
MSLSLSSSKPGRPGASVADKQIVLDANILVRAVLGVHARELIERYASTTLFYAPDVAFADAEEHLPGLYEKRNLSSEHAMKVYERISAIVQELPIAFYVGREEEARARIGARDPDDWPVMACALTLDCPIWTEDHDFFGAGVASWTTDRVEQFLSNVM